MAIPDALPDQPQPTRDQPQRAAGRGGRSARKAVRLPAELSSSQPRSHQLMAILEGLIASSSPGQPLPSERELAERYGVARMTARQVIETLASKGLVYRLQGSGTFVAEAKIAQPETLTSFSEDMKARGLAPGGLVLRQELRPAGDLVAARLNLPPGGEVVNIERVRTADGQPMAFETAYLPSHRFPGLESAELHGVSLYRLMEERWGVAVHVAHQWVAPVTLEPAQATLLGVRAGQPAFRFQRLTYDQAESPVEYVVSLYRGDRYEVHTRLERDQLTH
jgi:GntR family transcriptional regulator